MLLFKGYKWSKNLDKILLLLQEGKIEYLDDLKDSYYSNLKSKKNNKENFELMFNSSRSLSFDEALIVLKNQTLVEVSNNNRVYLLPQGIDKINKGGFKRIFWIENIGFWAVILGILVYFKQLWWPFIKDLFILLIFFKSNSHINLNIEIISF